MCNRVISGLNSEGTLCESSDHAYFCIHIYTYILNIQMYVYTHNARTETHVVLRVRFVFSVWYSQLISSCCSIAVMWAGWIWSQWPLTPETMGGLGHTAWPWSGEPADRPPQMPVPVSGWSHRSESVPRERVKNEETVAVVTDSYFEWGTICIFIIELSIIAVELC